MPGAQSSLTIAIISNITLPRSWERLNINPCKGLSLWLLLSIIIVMLKPQYCFLKSPPFLGRRKAERAQEVTGDPMTGDVLSWVRQKSSYYQEKTHIQEAKNQEHNHVSCCRPSLWRDLWHLHKPVLESGTAQWHRYTECYILNNTFSSLSLNAL